MSAQGLFEQYRSLLHPDRPWPVFGLALLLKGAIFLVMLSHLQHDQLAGYWGGIGGDTGSYLEPIEHLLETGVYAPNDRLPGYGLPYLVFRSVLPRVGAMNALLLFQVLMDALAVLVLAVIAFKRTHSLLVFRAVFWCYGIGSFVSVYNMMPMTETLTASMLVFTVYFITRSIDRTSRTDVLIAGCTMAWAAFMRPVMFPLVLLVLIVLVLAPGSPGRKKAAMAAYFLLPVLLCSAAWVVHVRWTEGKWLSPGRSYMMPDYLNSPNYHLGRVVSTFGGNLTWWYPDAEIRAFNIRDVHEPLELQAARPVIPAFAATPSFPMDSLNALADLVQTWNAATDSVRKKQLLFAIKVRSDRYVHTYASERPWQYHVVARLRLLRTFVFHNGASLPRHRSSSLLARIDGAIGLALYTFTMAFGCIGMMVVARYERSRSWVWIMTLFFGYGLLIHPLVMRFCEYRYLVPFYPFGLVLAVWCVEAIAQRRWRSPPSATNLEAPQ